MSFPKEAKQDDADMAHDDGSPERKPTATGWQPLIGIIPALAGLASVAVLFVGRLWVSAYFDHFGISSLGMDFSIDALAIRALEPLISLALGVLGLTAAWLSRDSLRRTGFGFAVYEFILIAVYAVLLFFMVPSLPDSLIASTGVLGVSSGLLLATMLFFAVHTWLGLGDTGKWARWAQIGLDRVWRTWRLKGRVNAEEVMPWVWRVAAGYMFVTIAVVHLPVVSQRLADLEASADVATGRFTPAILQSEDPLPGAIASSGDANKSDPVRVILTDSQNTYVLHSTTCTTMGELETPVSVEGFLPAEAPEACKVLAIPTARLRSIEYFQVRGNAPLNESPVHAKKVTLGEAPFEDSFSSEGASDESELACQEVRFFNSVWYEFVPASTGAVFARVESAEFEPVIGIWEASRHKPEVLTVTGSSADGSACETKVAVLMAKPLPDARGQAPGVVRVVANVRAGTQYVAAVGAQEDRGGVGWVSFDFLPAAYFFNPSQWDPVVPEGEVSPIPSVAEPLQVEIVSGLGTATLELWRLDPDSYELQPLADMPEDTAAEFLSGSFDLLSDGERRELVARAGEERPTALHAEALTQGVWDLDVPSFFVGLARLSATTHRAD